MAGHLRRHQDSEMLPQSSLVFNAVPCWGSSERSLQPISRVAGSSRNGTSDGCAGLQGSAPPPHWLSNCPVSQHPLGALGPGPFLHLCLCARWASPPGLRPGLGGPASDSRATGLLEEDRIAVCLTAFKALLTLSPWWPLSTAPGEDCGRGKNAACCIWGSELFSDFVTCLGPHKGLPPWLPLDPQNSALTSNPPGPLPSDHHW